MDPIPLIPSTVDAEVVMAAAKSAAEQVAAAAATTTIQRREASSVDVDVVNDDSGEPESEYEVDTILDTKMKKGKRFFFVKWKGYGPEYDSWEPIDILMEGARETVEEYMRVKNLPKPSGKKRGRPSGGSKKSKSPVQAKKKAPLFSLNNISTSASASKSGSKAYDSGSESDEVPAAPSADSESDYAESGPKSSKRAKKTKDKSHRNKGVPPLTIKLPAAARAARIANDNHQGGYKPLQKPYFMVSSPSSSEDESGSSKKAKKKHPQSPPPQQATSNTSTASPPARTTSGTALTFEGILRRTTDSRIAFVARQANSGNAVTYTLEEAVQTDPQSLARYLASRVEFVPDGTPHIPVKPTFRPL